MWVLALPACAVTASEMSTPHNLGNLGKRRECVNTPAALCRVHATLVLADTACSWEADACA